MNDERDARLYSPTPEQIVAAAGFGLSDWSTKRPGKPPMFALEQGRLTGYTDLYRKDGETMFGSVTLTYRVREPQGRIARRFDCALNAGIWEWHENYRGDDVERQLDRDCRAILLGLGQGQVLAGLQGGRFQMVLPYADRWEREPGVAGEVNSGALEEIDIDGLVDIRTLAFSPFEPVTLTRRTGEGLLGRLRSKVGRV